MYVRNWSMALGALALFAVAAILSGCARETEGGPGENVPPELFIVNIPADRSEFAVSPTIYWYGTDRDGQIERYDYSVVVAAEVDSIAAELPGTQSAVEKYIAFVLNDDFPRWVSIFPDSVEAGRLPTQEEVRLYASPFPGECDSVQIIIRDSQGNRIDSIRVPVDCVSDTIPQYFFLRAIDDRGAVSKVKYRSYKRRNHWPETSLQIFNPAVEYISLPRLTETFHGIPVRWRGTDRLDFLPPAVPKLEFHWRVYGPFPYDPSQPDDRPVLADTLGLQPLDESQSSNPLLGVWVRDTTTVLYDLWRQVDSRPDPLNDTTVTRSGWFMFVVTARDDAYISDETPSFSTFKASNPKFERKLLLVDETDYHVDTQTNPINDPTEAQAFYWRLVQSVYPEADTMQDFWWRKPAPLPNTPCPPSMQRVRCGNSLALELLLRHRMVIVVDDDVFDVVNPPGKAPAIRNVLRDYMSAGGMVWLIGRHSLLIQTEIGLISKERIFDLCNEDISSYDQLACQYFDLEGMYYPAWRRNVTSQRLSDEPAIPPTSNDEFIGARLATPIPGLPQMLEIDPARVDNMYLASFFRDRLVQNGVSDIPGVPDVNFLVTGTSATTLYLFESWRPGGPIPPYSGPSLSHGKPVFVRRVGPNRSTPVFKSAYSTFPLYFIKQEQTDVLFREMIEWFFLPFSQS